VRSRKRPWAPAHPARPADPTGKRCFAPAAGGIRRSFLSPVGSRALVGGALARVSGVPLEKLVGNPAPGSARDRSWLGSGRAGWGSACPSRSASGSGRLSDLKGSAQPRLNKRLPALKPPAPKVLSSERPPWEGLGAWEPGTGLRPTTPTGRPALPPAGPLAPLLPFGVCVARAQAPPGPSPP